MDFVGSCKRGNLNNEISDQMWMLSCTKLSFGSCKNLETKGKTFFPSVGLRVAATDYCSLPVSGNTFHCE